MHPTDSGELALFSVVAEGPDLILLDVRMPGIDEVCRRIKSTEAERPVPVIFLSSSPDKKDGGTAEGNRTFAAGDRGKASCGAGNAGARKLVPADRKCRSGDHLVLRQYAESDTGYCIAEAGQDHIFDLNYTTLHDEFDGTPFGTSRWGALSLPITDSSPVQCAGFRYDV